jgi:SAM-dependent methyltransferase
MTAKRLNLGCGTDIRPGWVNLDSADLAGVDVVHDLDRLPLPFEEGAFEMVECQDILEHVDLVPVLRDLHRILAPGGRLRIRSPHFTSSAYHIDPTHRRAFSIRTLDFFVSDSQFERDYYFDFHFSGVEQARILFHKTRGQPWNFLVEPLFNLHSKLQSYYEATFLARMFPALNVQVTLVK